MQGGDAHAPIPWMTLRMLAACGSLYVILMGSTFFSLGVILPHMMASVHMDWSQAGFGFTLLALAAGLSSMLPGAIIQLRGGRAAFAVGVAVMIAAYACLALCQTVAMYDAGTILLGIGFSLIGAVPGLHILGGWEVRRRAIVFGTYLALGGLGGAIWPSLAHLVIAGSGSWRGYWWCMAGLMGLAGGLSLLVIRDAPSAAIDTDMTLADAGFTLREAIGTTQFLVVAAGMAATYLVATTVNAFTVSYLAMIGTGTRVALATFSIQSACHAVFPLLMGGLADRVGAKRLLVLGLAMQAAGMVGLAHGTSIAMLVIFAIGVGGGYGTVFLATTLLLESYFGKRQFARIFGSNQLFTTISVVGPLIAGWVADKTGRLDLSFLGCAALLAATALWACTLRRPVWHAPLAHAAVS
jgi:OFA family oxalate/formate antiporter-like MFS transporter